MWLCSVVGRVSLQKLNDELVGLTVYSSALFPKSATKSAEKIILNIKLSANVSKQSGTWQKENSKHTLVCVRACVCIREQFAEFLSFHCVSPRDQTQVWQ